MSKKPLPIVNLDPALHRQTVINLLAAREAKKQASAAANAADKAIKAAEAMLQEAMNNSTHATCGGIMLSWTQSDNVPAKITLTSGDEITPDAIEYVQLKDSNRAFKPDEIAKIYGGRSGSRSLNITGVI